MSDTEDQLIPELGDMVTIISELYGSTTGTIIYRDEALIRIRPVNSSTTAVDFPLNPESGLFLDRLNVSELLIHAKRNDPHFARQLAVFPGDILEFYSTEGQMITSSTLREVIVTAEEDAVVLEDGTRIDFGFVGSPPPLDVVLPRAQEEVAVTNEDAPETMAEAAEEHEEPFPEIDYNLLPAALVEEVRTSELIYSDSIQREDMFLSLLLDVPPARQKDPKVQQTHYRRTDVLLALKNSIVQRNADGAVVAGAPPRSYMPESVQDSLAMQSTQAPLATLLPVAAIRKVLYADVDESSDMHDVRIQSDTRSLLDVARAEQRYSEESGEGNPYILYMNSLLGNINAYVPSNPVNGTIQVDQDVLRSQIPPKPVTGFAKVPPAFSKNREPIELTSASISSVNNRYVRVIGATRIRDPEHSDTSYLVAPGDNAGTLGHFVLTPGLSDYRSPTRSSVLLWDIMASMRSRNRSNFYTAFTTAMPDLSLITHTSEPLELVELITQRLQPSLNFINLGTLSVTDNLGLRDLEFSETVLDAMKSAVIAGTSAWQRAHRQLQARALDALSIPAAPAIAPIADADSPLFATAVLEHPELASAVNAIKDRERTLASYDLAYTQEFMIVSEQTLLPLYYAVVNNDMERVETLKVTYNSERARFERTTAVIRGLSKEFAAAPDINPCPHVYELEALMSIRDDKKRMLRLEEFLNLYQGGQKGNYILCSNCNRDLLCKHEVLLLNEFKHPGRGSALHKSLLLEYAGPVFEGAYICKTCGQKISDLEYDTHLEFDDEGRPLVGRSIIEDKEEDDDALVVIREEVAEQIEFKGADLKLYFIARTLFEKCGIVLPTDNYKRVVHAATDFLNLRVPNKTTYEAQIKAQMAALKGKMTPAPYENYYATYVVGVIGALVVLELQTSGVDVPFAPPGCDFSRDGFPVDGLDPAVVGLGAVGYVACNIATIYRDDEPWNLTSWSPKTDIKLRKTAAEGAIRAAIGSILCIPAAPGKPAPGPLTDITTVYTNLVTETREKKTATSVATVHKPSDADTLPQIYRPNPRVSEPGATEEQPVTNVEQFKKNLASKDIQEVRELVYSREQELNRKLMVAFHAQSAKTNIALKDASDGSCCFTRLSDVGMNGFGVAANDAVVAEANLIGGAAEATRRRDPAISASGTHILVPWSAPSVNIVLPEPDPETYYKLFLKSCYKGRKYGAPHEIGPDFVCRNCGFEYPKELLYQTGSEISTSVRNYERAAAAIDARRKELALEALSRNAEVNGMTYQQLDVAIRTRKMISPPEEYTQTPLLERLVALGQGLERFSAEAGWTKFIEGMSAIITENIVDDGPRRMKLVEFSGIYDGMRAAFETHSLRQLGRKAAPAIATMIEQVMGLTGVSEASIGVRNSMDALVIPANMIALNYRNAMPDANKWIPNISRSHNQDIRRVWDKASRVVSRGLDNLRENEEDVIKGVHDAFVRFAHTLGKFLKIYMDTLRAGSDLTETEYLLALRYVILSGLSALVNDGSPLYAGMPSPIAKANAAQFAANFLVDALEEGQKDIRQFDMTPALIEELLNARAEAEKALFIRKFDDLDRDLRKIELIKKKYKIGDWAVGTMKNLFSYNPEFYDHQREQLVSMGVLNEGAGGEDRYGRYTFGQEAQSMHDNLHRAAQDED